MSGGRLLVMLVILALGSAVLVGFVSRTPAAIRLTRPPPSAAASERGAEFTPAEVSRAGDFQGPAYLSTGLYFLITLVTLMWLARGPVGWLLDHLEGVPGGWLVRVVIAAAAVVLVLTLAALPLGFVSYIVNRAWDLSTQAPGDWLLDQGRSLLVAAVTAAVTALVFFGLVRWQPRTWWLWAWAAFSLLTAIMVFLYPLVIAPLFNKFTPLRDEALLAEVHRLASDAGVNIDKVLVADASKRTTGENAYVAGLGRSKELVVYDTLLRGQNPKETKFIIAHELGHEKENHVPKWVAISSAGLFIAFLVLWWFSHRGALLRWGGASSIADVRALPLLLLYATVATLITLPVQNAISRHFEGQADSVAIQLTHDPAPAVAAFRRLAFSNLSDLRPPRIAVWLLFTHPPVVDRIQAVLSGAKGSP